MTVLYRFFDDAEELLYVGITDNPPHRLIAHGRKKWWPQVSTITFERFDQRDDALKAELEAIRVEQPIHNDSSLAEAYAQKNAEPSGITANFEIAHFNHDTGRGPICGAGPACSWLSVESLPDELKQGLRQCKRCIRQTILEARGL